MKTIINDLWLDLLTIVALVLLTVSMVVKSPLTESILMYLCGTTFVLIFVRVVFLIIRIRKNKRAGKDNQQKETPKLSNAFFYIGTSLWIASMVVPLVISKKSTFPDWLFIVVAALSVVIVAGMVWYGIRTHKNKTTGRA